MKLFLISPDARGKVCGTNKTQLFDHLPLTRNYADADAVLLPISFFSDFVFAHDALAGIRKPIVVCDYLEYGWDFFDKPGRRTHIFGDGELPEYLQTNPEWAKLDRWLAEHPPVLTFKRELLMDDAGPRVRPIEFLCTVPAGPIQTRAEFDARPYDVSNIFGYSHPSRPRLHGDIFRAMGDRGINVISDWSQFENLPQPVPPKTWVSMYSPWWCRQPLGRVMDIQRKSKLSVSLPGAGAKAFRHAESPVDCIMAMHDSRLAWRFPWKADVNCIRVKPGYEFDGLMEALSMGSLYDIYRESQANIENYRVGPYIERHILPAIRECL